MLKILKFINLIHNIINSSIIVSISFFIIQSLVNTNLKADSQPAVVVHRSISKDGTRSFVSQYGNIEQTLSDLDDLFFEIESPEDIKYSYRVRIAKSFGSSFSRILTRVRLVIAEPFNGCGSEILNENEIKGNVAFIQRGDCSFLHKSINAEKSGALAAIITDNDPTNENLVDMITDETTRNSNIPVVFLHYKDGLMIKKSIERYHTKKAIINIPLNLTYRNKFVLKKAPWSIS